MASTCAAALLLLGRFSAADVPQPSAAQSGFPSFAAFVQSYGRSYRPDSPEWQERHSIYQRSVAYALLQNSRPNALWRAGVNEFSDWTEAEQLALRGWSRGARPERSSGGSLTQVTQRSFLDRRLANGSAPLPAAKSWQNLYAASAVRNQGACGSCWAIASATTLQAHTEVHTPEARTFSPQQLVSCVPNPQQCGGNGGCTGATVELAMEWVMQHGLATEYQVPYHGEEGQCPENATLLVGGGGGLRQGQAVPQNKALAFGMHGWERLPENQYEPLLRAVVERGPVAVSVAAAAWAPYAGGIFDGCVKDAIIDHAVVLFGFGQDAGKKFWLLQNSWGKYWGEDGMIRMLRHDNSSAWCGIDRKPELGTGCKCGVLYDSVVPHF